MVKCFINGCETNVEERKGLHSSHFKVPKGKLLEWQAYIPTKGMKNSSSICWRHFDDHDLIKGKMKDKVFIPRNDYWHLRKGAVPRLHLGNIKI